jgi:hypothetical protein
MPNNSEPPALVELRSLVDQAKNGRLPAPEERRAAELIRELVLAGGKISSGTLELMGEMPWFLAVQGTVEVWPQLTPARRRSYLTFLRNLNSESSRRTCLSIARSLFKIDPPAGAKLAAGTIAAMRGSSGLEIRDRQTIFNVFVGKNKPWILQVDLSTIKPADLKPLAEALLECVTFASPPAAISLIRWAKPFAALSGLAEPLQQDLGKTVRKWSSRWRKELAELDPPPVVKEAVTVRPAPPKSVEPAKPAAQPAQPTPPVKVKPPHPKRGEGREPEEQLGFKQLLKQIEDRFSSLQSELAELKHQRPKEHLPRGRVEHPRSNEEVAKLQQENQQLSQTVAELRQTLSDLAATNFEEAVSRRSDTDAPLTDPVAQYRSLLTLRLSETMTRFQEINRANQADALPLLLENILVVLEQNGIDLSGITAPPAPARRRY